MLYRNSISNLLAIPVLTLTVFHHMCKKIFECCPDRCIAARQGFWQALKPDFAERRSIKAPREADRTAAKSMPVSALSYADATLGIQAMEVMLPSKLHKVQLSTAVA